MAIEPTATWMRLAWRVLRIGRDDVEPGQGQAAEAARRRVGSGVSPCVSNRATSSPSTCSAPDLTESEPLLSVPAASDGGKVERLDLAAGDVIGGKAGQPDLRIVLADDVDRGNDDLLGDQFMRQREFVVARRVGRQEFDDFVFAEIGVGEFDMSDGESIAVDRFERQIVDRHVAPAGDRPAERGRRSRAGSWR